MPDKNGAVYLSEFMRGEQPPVVWHFSKEEWERARRAADLINEARATLDWEQLKNCWIAIRLSDGGSDMVIYDCKRDAVRFQVHEKQCVYFCFRNLIGGASARELVRVIRFHEMAYEAGFGIPDPDDEFGGPDPAPTSRWMDHVDATLEQSARKALTR
jgi:hypothetical protein